MLLAENVSCKMMAKRVVYRRQTRARKPMPQSGRRTVMPVTVGRGNANEAEVRNKKISSQ
jgi:hypothetical protein